MTQSTSTASAPTRHLAGGVEIVDIPEERQRDSGDLVGMVVTALGVIAVLVLALYAQAAVVGVAEDAHNITHVLDTILQVLVNVIEGAVVLILPAIILADLVWHRLWRLATTGVGAAIAAFGLAWAANVLLTHLSSTSLVQSVSLTVDYSHIVGISSYAVALSALLTTIGPRSRRASFGVTWNVLFIALAGEVITGHATLPGALVAILLGRLVGQITRYVFGVDTNRAYGGHLALAIKKAGVIPTRIVRQIGLTEDGKEISRGLPVGPSLNRLYAAYDAEGERWDIAVLDGDRQAIGRIARWWQAIRMRGFDQRSVTSLRQATERAALLNYAAKAAGVRTIDLIGVSQEENSMLLVFKHENDLVQLSDIPGEDISDELLHDVWRQLLTAHKAGLAHRAVTSDAILVGKRPLFPGARRPVWLIGWGYGDVASSDLARRLDIAQTLAMLTLLVGTERAVRSANHVVDQETLAEIAPVLQPIALPEKTRLQAKNARKVLADLREALVNRFPSSDTEPLQLARFGWRTILTASLMVIALIVLFANINLSKITDAIATANLWWLAASFAFGIVTYIAAAVVLIAFTPVRISLIDGILTHYAASFAGLMVPSGLGPAALNLRLLSKRKVNTPLAVATVTLVQVTQGIVTIIVVIGLWLVTGNSKALQTLPHGTVLVVVGIAAAAVAALMLFAPLRHWVWKKIGPTWQQVWPRLVWVLSQPRRLMLGTVGNVLQTLGYVLAFWAATKAFGAHLAITDVAIVFLVFNTVGSMVPTPGGIGSVELGLTTGLLSIGMGSGVAGAAVILYRVANFWITIPMGWFAWRWLQKRKIL